MVVVTSCWDPLINKLPIKEGYIALLPVTSCWVLCDELVYHPEKSGYGLHLVLSCWRGCELVLLFAACWIHSDKNSIPYRREWLCL